jgi:aryl-alcohol dehydrogenase-like predicted oxidoreductase
MSATRRDFLRASAGVAGAAWSRELLAQDAPAPDAPMPRRTLGKTGLRVSILSQGGHHLSKVGEEDAVALVHRAIDLGVNFFDNAWNYYNGMSEERLGKALKTGGRRDKVFIMTKSEERKKAGALRQIDESLKRMQTDRIDLWQFHALQRVSDVETIWGPGGAMEGAREALQAGKILHIGLTGHTDPACHLRALDFEGVEALQMPVNPLDAHYLSFQNRVIPKAKAKGVGIIAMKTLCYGKALEKQVYTAAEALRYVWSLETNVLVSGMTSIAQLEHNAARAKAFTPMPDAEREALLARVKPHAGAEFEFFKKKV